MMLLHPLKNGAKLEVQESYRKINPNLFPDWQTSIESFFVRHDLKEGKKMKSATEVNRIDKDAVVLGPRGVQQKLKG